MVTSVITEKERKKMMTWTSEKKKKKRTTWNWNQAPPKRADGQKQKATQFIPGCGVTRLLPKQNPPQKKIGNIALSSSPSKKRCQKKRIFFIALPFSFCTLTLRPPRYKTFQKKKIIFCPLIRFSMEHSSSSSKAAFLQRQSKWMTHTWDPATIRVSFFKKKKTFPSSTDTTWALARNTYAPRSVSDVGSAIERSRTRREMSAAAAAASSGRATASARIAEEGRR